MSASCDCTMTRQGVTTSMYTVICKQRHRQVGRLWLLYLPRAHPLCTHIIQLSWMDIGKQRLRQMGRLAPPPRMQAELEKGICGNVCMYLRVYMYVFTFDGFSNPNCMDVRRTVLGIPDVFARPSFGRRLMAEVAMKATRSIGR